MENNINKSNNLENIIAEIKKALGEANNSPNLDNLIERQRVILESIRVVDNSGRIVIPKEMRNHFKYDRIEDLRLFVCRDAPDILMIKKRG